MNNKDNNNTEKNALQSEKGVLPREIQQNEQINPDNKVAEGEENRKPGAILKEKRLESGFSEEQIAARLKMTARQVRLLEEDNYDALHGVAISRGFVRAYARVLKVDPEPLVAMFADSIAVPKKTPSNVSVQPSGERFVQNQVFFRRKSNTTRNIVIVLIIVIVLAVLAWNMKRFSSSAKVEKKENVEATMPKEEVKQDAVANAPAATDAQNPGAKTEGVDANAATQQVNSPAPAQQPAPANGVQPAASADTAEAAQVSVPVLKVTFKEKSWIQIRKQSGATLKEFIGKPGEQHQIEVNEPVMVTVGFAPGVSMEFNGSPVDLASNTTNSVARINLK